jgi:hypothetical protein
MRSIRFALKALELVPSIAFCRGWRGQVLSGLEEMMASDSVIREEEVVKALSVRQPYAWLIVTGAKLIENQHRLHLYRGELAIHASLKRDSQPMDEIERRYAVRVNRDALRFGGIVGVVSVVNAVEGEQPLIEQLACWRNTTYRYGLILADARQIAFVPFAGKLSLFDVPDELIDPPAPQSGHGWVSEIEPTTIQLGKLSVSQ